MSASLRTSLQLAAVRQELAGARRDAADARKERDHALRQLESARAAPRVKLSPGKPRTARKGDVVRVCFGDSHGAKASPAAVAALLGDIKALDPDEIIMLGDHVDCGGFLAQHHTLGYVAETGQSYEQDIAAANGLLDALQSIAPRARILYIEGNHERRVETWCITQTLRHQRDSEYLRRAFAPEFLLNLAARGIPYYRQGECYDGLHVPGFIRRGKVYFTHGISTAKHATAASQSRVAGNLVFGHTHRAQTDITHPMAAGIVGSWNPGCLCELQPLWQHTRPTDWTHGYAIQLVAPSQNFLHLNIPILEGESLLTSLLKR